MSKKERTKLITALNTALALYVKPEDRAHFAKMIAESLGLDFVDHFVEAAIRD